MTRKLVLTALAAVCLAATPAALAAPPANDNFANAVALGAPPSQVTGTNIEATTQPNEPTAHGSNKTVWWKWAADQTGRFRVDACDTLPVADLDIAIYTGAAVNALTNVTVGSTRGSGDPTDYGTGACAASGTPAAVFDATAGQTYFVAIGASGCCTETSSNIVLKLSKSAVNDNFAEATAVAAVPSETTGSNVFASVEVNEPDGHGPASIWWKWTADQAGRFRADTCGTLPDADLVMAVYTGATVAALTNVTVAASTGNTGVLDYGTGDCADNSHPAVVFDATPGQTYYFAVGAAGCCTETSPNIVFRLNKSAVNDNLAETLTLTGAPHARATGTNVFASREVSEPDHGEASIWWKWTAPQTGPYMIHTCNTLPAADTVVRLYQGVAVSALAAVQADYAGCARKKGTVARFKATAGQVYLITVAAAGCCTFTSPGIVLTLRDRDCDSANSALRKAKKKAKNAKRALARAKRKGKGVRKAQRNHNSAKDKVTKAKKAAAKRC